MWTVTVTVGGADVSDRVTGIVQVSAEENQARTATVSYAPGPGVYTPESLVGAAVAISYDGLRIFTGRCNWPSLDSTRSVISLQCSDMLQTDFEGMTDAQILAAIPGARLSDEIFGEREDGWQRAQDALSTVRSEAHKDALGNLVVSPWDVQGGASHTFGVDQVVHETPAVTFAEHRQIINTISVGYKYRYSRFKVREHTFGWPGWSSNFGGSTYCNWRDEGYPLLPKMSNFENAAAGAGWNIVGGISFGRLPGPGVYDCGSGPIIWLGARNEDGTPYDETAQREANDGLVTGAGWTTRKRFAQTITEDYALTVSSAESVGLFGSLPGEDGAVYETPAEMGDWEASEDASIPPTFAQDAIGDWVEDQGDRAEADNVVQCILQIADARIAASHRLNYVEWQAACVPTLELAQKVAIAHPAVSATGKVAQFQHTLDTGTGRAVSTIKIACFRGGGGAQSVLDPPTVPPSAPTHPAPPDYTGLGTFVGGESSSPDWNEGARDGESYVSTNVQAQSASRPEQYYPRRVEIVGPDIEQEARDNFDAPQTQGYSVHIPDDPMTVSTL